MNDKLSDEPGVVNSSPEKNGWMAKIEIKDQDELSALMDTQQYSDFIEKLN